MENEEYKKFHDEIRAVTEKYGVTAAVFTGSSNTEGACRYLGFIIGKINLMEHAECTFNVGRLWQHMRTEFRKTLDRFEGKI